ncbi:chromosome partitioning protein [Micromonospora mangrovi]|uniref:Chromosome partitioning protein n=2 Tax=Micromonospora TaxID=1873 RepID=A0AAU7M585_9ACTN
MVHENADRAHVPGQQPVPERDIEPLWPEETVPDPVAAAWAVPAQPGAPVVPPPAPPVPADARPAGPGDEGGGSVGDAPPTAATRVPGESPWAQPPQRPTPTDQPQPNGATLAPSADAGGVPPTVTAPVAGPPTAALDPGSAAHGALPAPPPLGPFPPAAGGPVHHPGPVVPGQPTGGTPGHPSPPVPPYAGPPAPQMPVAHPQPSGWQPWPERGGPAPQPPGPPQPTLPGTPAGPFPPGAGLPAYPDPAWLPESGVTPTAEDFSRRRQVRPADPVATMGVRAVVNRIGLVRLPPGRHEQELKRDIEMVRRNFGGLRQVTVVNPKGGAGKTVAILLLAMTFGQKRGGYVLAWDNNETQGTLGMRAQQDFHSRTVRDMLRDLGQFQGAHGRVGDLSQYVRSQGEGMFDVLASDESATGGEMLTAAAFAEIREVVSRFYKLIFVDTGNNVRAQNWQAAMDATDQLVVTMSARNDSAETAARMLDHLEQSGRQRLVRQAVTVVSMPPSRKEIDLPAIQEHFAARTRAVLLAPYERLIDTGEPIRYGQLSSATRDAWLKIAAAVAEGL